ncbi:MAG: hypothetical protein H6728_15065 [Myxococcales bacterium]|nr:hypothetical protein [Myxococcales bacterium]
MHGFPRGVAQDQIETWFGAPKISGKAKSQWKKRRFRTICSRDARMEAGHLLRGCSIISDEGASSDGGQNHNAQTLSARSQEALRVLSVGSFWGCRDLVGCFVPESKQSVSAS